MFLKIITVIKFQLFPNPRPDWAEPPKAEPEFPKRFPPVFDCCVLLLPNKPPLLVLLVPKVFVLDPNGFVVPVGFAPKRPPPELLVEVLFPKSPPPVLLVLLLPNEKELVLVFVLEPPNKPPPLFEVFVFPNRPPLFVLVLFPPNPELPNDDPPNPDVLFRLPNIF